MVPDATIGACHPCPAFVYWSDTVLNAQRKQDQHNAADRDSVPGERRKAIARDKVHQAAHHQQPGEERRDEAHRNRQPVVERQQVPLLVQVVGGRRRHGRDRQEERELGGCPPVDAHEQRPHDGRAGPRHTGDHRQALHQANAQRQAGREVLDDVMLRLLDHAFDRQDRQSANNERHSDAGGVLQQRLDLLVDQQPDKQGRQEAQQHGDAEADRLVVPAQQAGRDPNQPLPIGDAYRQDRAQLNGDLEGVAGVAKADEVPGDHQMPGRGDGNELGQAFQQAEQQRLGKVRQVHEQSLFKGARFRRSCG